jgi:colicin import membrane protein
MDNFEAVFSIKLKSDGTLESTPQVHRDSKGSGPFFRPYLESGLRAIIECQPYKLPQAYFEEWRFFEPGFKERRT